MYGDILPSKMFLKKVFQQVVSEIIEMNLLKKKSPTSLLEQFG